MSRALGTDTETSDWDFALYYRSNFDPDGLRALGFSGEVFDVGAWGGGVMNGGAWLTIEGRRVDVMYRDLNDVEHCYARTALDLRGDTTVAAANGSRALIELAHSRAALERRWVLNEKGLVKASGLADLGDALAFAADHVGLADALRAIENVVSGGSSAE